MKLQKTSSYWHLNDFSCRRHYRLLLDVHVHGTCPGSQCRHSLVIVPLSHLAGQGTYLNVYCEALGDCSLYLPFPSPNGSRHISHVSLVTPSPPQRLQETFLVFPHIWRSDLLTILIEGVESLIGVVIHFGSPSVLIY
jgi:hypothetical protein